MQKDFDIYFEGQNECTKLIHTIGLLGAAIVFIPSVSAIMVIFIPVIEKFENRLRVLIGGIMPLMRLYMICKD